MTHRGLPARQRRIPSYSAGRSPFIVRPYSGLREQIREEMRADLIAAKGEEYVAALDARIAEIVATHPLFRGEHQE